MMSLTNYQWLMTNSVVRMNANLATENLILTLLVAHNDITFMYESLIEFIITFISI